MIKIPQNIQFWPKSLEFKFLYQNRSKSPKIGILRPKSSKIDFFNKIEWKSPKIAILLSKMIPNRLFRPKWVKINQRQQLWTKLLKIDFLYKIGQNHPKSTFSTTINRNRLFRQKRDKIAHNPHFWSQLSKTDILTKMGQNHPQSTFWQKSPKIGFF